MNVESLPPEVELLLCAVRSQRDSARLQGIIERGVDWDRVIDLAHWHGVLPLVDSGLKESAPGRVPQPVQARLRDGRLVAAARHAILTGELLAILGELEADGVRAMPFKGPVLVAQLYGGKPLRGYSDLDILVALEDAGKAKKVLRRRGYATTADVDAPQRLPAVRSAGELPFRRADGIEVDLHWRLGPQCLPEPISHQDRWERAVQVRLGPADVWSMCAEHLLLGLCFHGAKSGWYGLKWICDLDRLLAAYRVDWDMVEALAASTRCKRMLLAGLLLAEELLGAVIPAALSGDARRDARVARVAAKCRLLLSCDERQGESVFTAAGWLLQLTDSPLDRLRYLAALVLLPTPAEWEMVRLPRALWFAYYLLRLVRLGARYTVGRVLKTPPPAPAPAPAQCEVTFESVVVRSVDTTFCSVGGIPIVVRLADGATYRLDAAGKRIWELTAKPAKVSDLMAQCGRKDAVLSFLRQLSAAGLIRPAC